MREFHTQDSGHIIHRVDVSAAVKSLWVREAVREYSIENLRESHVM